jgi:hypothetical protein
MAPKPSGDPEGVGRGGSFSFGNHWTRGLTYLYVRISSPPFAIKITCYQPASFAHKFWFFLLRRVGLQVLTPQSDETSFDDWWDKSSNAMDVHLRKGLNSIIILGAWTLWNICNRCVFDAESPNLARALLLTSEEVLYWSLAGA